MSELTAYHEAGHAFMAVYVGARVRSVTIEPDDDDGPQRYGDTQVEWPGRLARSREGKERSVLVAMAGPVVEMLHQGEPTDLRRVPEWADDWMQAWNAAAALVPSQQQRWHYLRIVMHDLMEFFNNENHWAAVGAIVDCLLAHETLCHEEVADIVHHWLRR